MSNHIHIVVVQGESPLATLAKSTHIAFAKWIQRNHRRRKASGPIFADRPREVLVDSESYLLELVRYVHNNPVRAGVVRRARSSSWSSHQAYIGRAEAPGWLRVGYVLDRFGRRVAKARSKLDAFVDEGRDEPRRPDLSGALDPTEAAAVREELRDGHRVSDGILGDEGFVARVLADVRAVEDTLSRRGVELRRGRHNRPELPALWSAVQRGLDIDPLQWELRPRARRHVHARRLLVWLWVREFCGKQIDVAKLLSVSTATVALDYRRAVCHAAEFEEQGSAILSLLPARKGRRTKRAQRVGASGADYRKVRCHRCRG